MTLKGLIPGTQKNINVSPEKWEYGNVINNNKKIDAFLGLGCFTLGFKRHDIIDHVCEQLKHHVYDNAEALFVEENIYLHNIAFQLSEKLYQITDGYKSFFALSGSDANEGAVKLAAAYHKLKGNNKDKVIAFHNSYHGSTFLNHNMGNALSEDPFYNLKKYDGVQLIKKDFEKDSVDWGSVMCIIVETRSWSSLLNPEPEGFWQKLKDIQGEHDVLIIIDDIFIGGGKTGQFVGWQHLDIKPDIFTMGKSITGGYFPLSVTLYNEKVYSVLPKNFVWDHGFTYSFSSAGILSTLKYMDILEKEKIFENIEAVRTRAEHVFYRCNYKVINNLGVMYFIQRQDSSLFYIIPLNATDEYFQLLEQSLI